MTTQPVTAGATRTESRHEVLLDKIGTLNGRRGGWPLHRVFFLTGSVLLPLGLVLLVFGWIGAARSVLLFEQLSYIASGGLIGLALVLVGSALYFAHWQVLVLEEAKEQTRLAVQQNDVLVEHLEHLAAAVTAVGQRPAQDSTETSAALVATLRGSMAHKPSCSMVRGHSGLRSLATEDLRTLRACGVCNPDIAGSVSGLHT